MIHFLSSVYALFPPWHIFVTFTPRQQQHMPQGFLPWGYDMNHPYHKYERRYVGVHLILMLGVVRTRVSYINNRKVLAQIIDPKLFYFVIHYLIFIFLSPRR